MAQKVRATLSVSLRGAFAPGTASRKHQAVPTLVRVAVEAVLVNDCLTACLLRVPCCCAVCLLGGSLSCLAVASAVAVLLCCSFVFLEGPAKGQLLRLLTIPVGGCAVLLACLVALAVVLSRLCFRFL